MAEGELRGENIRQGNDPFISRFSNQASRPGQGLFNLNSQGGQSSVGQRGFLGRSSSYSPLNSSTWRSILGLEPNTALFDSPNRTGLGANTSRSALWYNPPVDATDGGELTKYGEGAYGGESKVFEFNKDYESNYSPIAKSGRVGVKASDPTGDALSVGQYTIPGHKEYDSEDISDNSYYSDKGFIDANLRSPYSKIGFDNNISLSLAGRGSTTKDVQSGQGGNTVSQTLSDTVNKVTAPIPLIGGLISNALSSYDKKESNLTQSEASLNTQMGNTVSLASPGSVNFGRSMMAGIQGGMNSNIDPNLDLYNSLMARGASRGALNMGDGASGVVNIDNSSDTSSNTQEYQEQHDWKKAFGGEHKEQTASGLVNSKASIGLKGQASVESTQDMAYNSVPQDWISSKVSPDLQNNFQSYKERYPRLFGNYNSAQDYITSQYFKDNPMAKAKFDAEMQSMSENSVMGMPNRVSAQGQISGDLGASGKAQGMLNTSQNATSSIANQGLISLPGTGLITNQGASSSSNSGKVSAEGKLIGEQAQVQGLLDLKNSYGKDQKIKLQLDQQAKSITDIIPQSDENINLINKIKDFPELASLFNNPSNTPEFIASIISSYNKNETDSLEGWNIIPGVGASAKYGHYISGNNNLQASSQVNRSRTQTQEYDPTPNDPTSGDEVQLANVGGRVVAIPKGQLITQNYKNSVSTYSPEYDVAMNNYISNGQQGDVPVNTGDIYTKDYDYNQYFWANGDNQDVNMLMGGLMSRAYDDQAGYDYTGADSIYNQIRGLDSTASWGGYNYSQLQSMADMYDLERQRDLSGYSLSDNYNKSSSYNYRAY